jgi:hypothetical protein
MKPTNDKKLLDLIERHEAWLTYASDYAGTGRAWRCAVADRHFDRPDIRERMGREGFGLTARDAIAACFQSSGERSSRKEK